MTNTMTNTEACLEVLSSDLKRTNLDSHSQELLLLKWKANLSAILNDALLVTSSNLEAVKYDTDAEGLTVRFKGGGEYWYTGVSMELFEAFVAAPSSGKFFHGFVKGKFPYKKLNG